MANTKRVRMWACTLGAALAAACGDGASAPSGPDGIRLSISAATLEPGDTLRIGVLPEVAAEWTSSAPDVAAVSPQGVVTAVSEGTARVNATARGGSATAQVTVRRPPVSGPALAFHDGFESGALSFTGADGYRWRRPSADPASEVSVSRDVARTGAHSLRFLYGGDPSPCDDAWAEQRFEMGEKLQEVWLEYYVYFPDGTEGIGPAYYHREPHQKNADGTCSEKGSVSSNNKFLVLWDESYNEKHVKASFEYRRTPGGADGDSYLYGMWCNDTRKCSDWNHSGSRWDPAFTAQSRGRWVQVRVHTRVADSKEAANGVHQLWADGVLRIDMRGLDLAPEAGGNRYFRNGYIMGWANSGFDRNTAVYVDDFRIYRMDPGWS